MSSKIEIDAVAGAGSVWIEEADIEDVSPARDGQHAATVTVRWRKQYQEAEAFEWMRGGKLLRLQLLPRQVRASVEQLRESQTAFCNGEREAGCYDYGKVETPPASCVRCLLLDACRRSRMGDLRRASPAATYGPGSGLVVAFVILMVLWVWTLNRWASAAVEADRSLQALQACRGKQSPIGKR